MDVLIGMVQGTLQRPPKPPSRVFRYAVGASVVAHGALMATVLLLPRSAQPTEVSIEVNVVSEPPVEVVAPPPDPEQAPVVPVRERLVLAKAAASAPPRRLEPPEAANMPQSPQPPPREEPAAEAAPAAETPEPTAPATADDKGTTLVATAPGGLSSPSGGARYGRAGSGTVAGTGNGIGGVVNGPRRHTLIDGYRNELLRTRIAGHFHYPAEARELELTGQVMVAVTIRKDGHLLNVRLAGRCPHAILCNDGLRTIRASAPFPPIPDVLGDSLQIEVPFNYSFE